MLSSVVNGGLFTDPTNGSDALAFVSAGNAARLGHVRNGSEITMITRRGWRWVGVTGPATVVGPDDPADGFDAERIRVLLRDVFTAAGGTHDDWEEYDRAMLAERRAAVFVAPNRILGNG